MGGQARKDRFMRLKHQTEEGTQSVRMVGLKIRKRKPHR